MRPHPEYAALVKLLAVLRRLPDATSETTLTPEEAAKIRSLGFAAQAGWWKVPPVQPELVRDNPLFEHLSIGWTPVQGEAAPNGARTQSQSCDVAQIIKGEGRPVLAAKKGEGIRQPINASEQKADRQDSELAVLSEHTTKGEDSTFPGRRKAGYQLPPTAQEQVRMAQEAASRIARTLNKAYWEGKRVKVRDLQQRQWRFPASVFHQALRILERAGRILYQFNEIRVTPPHYWAKRS